MNIKPRRLASGVAGVGTNLVLAITESLRHWRAVFPVFRKRGSRSVHPKVDDTLGTPIGFDPWEEMAAPTAHRYARRTVNDVNLGAIAADHDSVRKDVGRFLTSVVSTQPSARNSCRT
jgi:hypothetical protein